MKLRSLGLIVACVALASVFYGCATSQGVTPGQGLDTFTRETRHTPGNECQWSFDRNGASKKIKNLTIDANNGTCSINNAQPFFMGLDASHVYPVKKLDATVDEINLEGSCKYCYIDTAGNLSCVSYPGTC
jgi:hypothetical protein